MNSLISYDPISSLRSLNSISNSLFHLLNMLIVSSAALETDFDT